MSINKILGIAFTTLLFGIGIGSLVYAQETPRVELSFIQPVIEVAYPIAAQERHTALVSLSLKQNSVPTLPVTIGLMLTKSDGGSVAYVDHMRSDELVTLVRGEERVVNLEYRIPSVIEGKYRLVAFVNDDSGNPYTIFELGMIELGKSDIGSGAFLDRAACTIALAGTPVKLDELPTPFVIDTPGVSLALECAVTNSSDNSLSVTPIVTTVRDSLFGPQVAQSEPYAPTTLEPKSQGTVVIAIPVAADPGVYGVVAALDGEGNNVLFNYQIPGGTGKIEREFLDATNYKAGDEAVVSFYNVFPNGGTPVVKDVAVVVESEGTRCGLTELTLLEEGLHTVKVPIMTECNAASVHVSLRGDEKSADGVGGREQGRNPAGVVMVIGILAILAVLGGIMLSMKKKPTSGVVMFLIALFGSVPLITFAVVSYYAASVFTVASIPGNCGALNISVTNINSGYQWYAEIKEGTNTIGFGTGTGSSYSGSHAGLTPGSTHSYTARIYNTWGDTYTHPLKSATVGTDCADLVTNELRILTPSAQGGNTYETNFNTIASSWGGEVITIEPDAIMYVPTSQNETLALLLKAVERGTTFVKEIAQLVFGELAFATPGSTITVPNNSASQGDKIHLFAKIINTGNAAAVTDFNNQFSYQYNGTGGAWTNFPNTTVTRAQLPTTGKAVDGANVTVPNTSGTLYIRHCLDVNNTVNELSDDNCTISSGIVVSSPIEVPTGLTATPKACGTKQLEITWNDPLDITEYDLEINGTIVYGVFDSALSGTPYKPYVHTTAADDSINQYRVRSVYGGSTSAWSSVVQGQAPSACPNQAPTLIRPTSTNAVFYTGAAGNLYAGAANAASSTDPEGDQVHYGFDDGSDGSIDRWIPASGYQAAAIGVDLSTQNPLSSTPGTYTVRWFVEDSKGARSPSVTNSFSLVDSNFVADPGTCANGSVNLSWALTPPGVNPDGVSYRTITPGASYMIYRSTYQFGFTPKFYILSATTSSIIDTDNAKLVPGSTHKYTLALTQNLTYPDGSTRQTTSAIKEFTVTIPNNSCTPSVPTGLVASPQACGTGNMDISWNSVSGATGYKLYDNGNPVPIYTGGNTGYTQGGLAASSSHSYTVAATSATGESAQSAAVVKNAPDVCPNQAPTLHFKSTYPLMTVGVIGTQLGTGDIQANGTSTRTFDIATSTDPEGDQVRYGLDDGNDGMIDRWIPASGYQSASASTSLVIPQLPMNAGPYAIGVVVEDSKGARSATVVRSFDLIDQGFTGTPGACGSNTIYLSWRSHTGTNPMGIAYGPYSAVGTFFNINGRGGNVSGTTSKTYTGLVPGASYTYKLREEFGITYPNSSTSTDSSWYGLPLTVTAPAACVTKDLVSENLSVTGTFKIGQTLNLSAVVRNAGTQNIIGGAMPLRQPNFMERFLRKISPDAFAAISGLRGLTFFGGLKEILLPHAEATLGTFSDDFSYQWNGTGGAWTQIGSLIPHDSLAAGASLTDTTTFPLTQTGTLYIQHCVDSNHQIDEGTAETPNCTVSIGYTISDYSGCAAGTQDGTCAVGGVDGVANGATSGSCVNGFKGNCSYTCSDGTWGAPSSNTCAAPTITQFEVCTGVAPCTSAPGTHLVATGTPLTLHWAANADNCSAVLGNGFSTGAGDPPTGSADITAPATPNTSEVYQIGCRYGTGVPVTESLTVTSYQVLPKLTAASTTVKEGKIIRLAWDTNNGDATTCTLTGGSIDGTALLSGSTGETGFADVTIQGRTTFILTCGGQSDVKTIEIVPTGWED